MLFGDVPEYSLVKKPMSLGSGFNKNQLLSMALGIQKVLLPAGML